MAIIKTDEKNINLNKRQLFLNSFLGALGAEKIEWKKITPEFVKGTVIYDESDIDETQDFIWRKTELEAPDKNTQVLMDYIKTEKLLDIDKLTKSINEINIPNLNNEQIINSFEHLFDISITMIDEGQETDMYFIHD